MRLSIRAKHTQVQSPLDKILALLLILYSSILVFPYRQRGPYQRLYSRMSHGSKQYNIYWYKN